MHAAKRARHSFVLSTAAALVVVAALSSAACSSGSDNHPAGLDTGGTSSSAGSSGASSGSATDVVAGSGAAAGDASSFGGETAGSSGDTTVLGAGNAGNGGSASSGQPPPPSLCSETAVWSGASNIANVSTSANETLLSVTSDELDLAFLRSGALYVGHRADKAGAFSVGIAIIVPDGWSAAQGVALSADGKRLVLVSTDQTLLGEMTRTTRDAAFTSSIDQTAFATINQTSLYSDNVYAAPVLSPDDQQLYLSSASSSGSSTVVASTRNGTGPWTTPSRVIAELDGVAGERRLPTGISADERTLFYFNEASMKEEARWRNGPQVTSALYDMVDLGTRHGAQPNAACDKLYSDSAGDVIVQQD